MQISEILRRKGDAVVTAPPQTTVRDLLALLREHHVGALVVSADGATVAGIVSERDVVRRLATTGGALLDQPIADIMTVQVRTCEPGEKVNEMMVLMTEQRFRHVPVVEHGRLVGIVSIGDIVKTHIEELQTERDQLSAYISS